MIKTKKVNGINYVAVKGNDNSDRILIFLPGIGSFKENYIKHLFKLRPYYKTLYSVDLPEQGSKRSWGIGNTVDNLKEFINIIDDNNIRSIHLSGHSVGALSAYSFSPQSLNTA